MLKKTAIAIPPELLASIDEVAEERGESRNAFITVVLTKAVRARRDWEITEKLNALFGAADVKRAHRAEALAFDKVGDDWGDERW